MSDDSKRRSLITVTTMARSAALQRENLKAAVRTAEAEGANIAEIHAAAGPALGIVEDVHSGLRFERCYRAASSLRVWTNEDGKGFVFADELSAALEVPYGRSDLVAEQGEGETR